MKSLKRMYDFRKSHSGVDTARKFRKDLFDALEGLKNFPRLGKKETSLVDFESEYRSLIVEKCKIIYRIGEKEIFIIEVFDTRQNPDSLIF